MNKTRIEYLDWTWNPAVGCLGVGCEVHRRGVCWAEAQAKRQKPEIDVYGQRRGCQLCYDFTPHLHLERLAQPLRVKTPGRIGVCFMSDLFGLSSEMIKKILSAMEAAPWHTFVLLTKMPQNALEFRMPSNAWMGVTVNSQVDAWRLEQLAEIRAPIRFVSFEPLYGAVEADLSGLDWVIIGAQTRPTLRPKLEWVEEIITEARRARAAVFLKDNLGWPPIREHPKEAAEG